MPGIVVHETKELDDRVPDTKKSEAGPWLSELSGGSTKDKHAHLDRSDGIWELF
jgi:hypothetical protein